MSPTDFLADLLNPDLTFLPKALAIAVISSVVCGIVGTHVVLRGMAFIGDAVSHAVFPGLAIAFVIEGDLVLGGTLAGVATAVLVAVFSQNRRRVKSTRGASSHNGFAVRRSNRSHNIQLIAADSRISSHRKLASAPERCQKRALTKDSSF